MCNESLSKCLQAEGCNKAAEDWPQGRCGKKDTLCPWLLYTVKNVSKVQISYRTDSILERAHYAIIYHKMQHIHISQIYMQHTYLTQKIEVEIPA